MQRDNAKGLSVVVFYINESGKKIYPSTESMMLNRYGEKTPAETVLDYNGVGPNNSEEKINPTKQTKQANYIAMALIGFLSVKDGIHLYREEKANSK